MRKTDWYMLDTFRALGTRVGATATLVTADVKELTVDAAAETTVEIPAGEVWRRG